MFVPDNVNVPDPDFVILPEPLITPENVSFPLSPVVNVIPLASSTLPAPLNDCIVSQFTQPITSPAILEKNEPASHLLILWGDLG